MEIIGKEEYDLPIYEEPLLQLTSSPVEDGPRSTEGDVELDTGILQIEETLGDLGRSYISVVHRVGGEKVGRYRFEILNRDQRICRYTGNEDPPWSVYCAVTNFGYSCQSAPESERLYALDLLHAGAIELLQRVQEQEYEYFVGWGVRVVNRLYHYIQLAALEHQVGPDQMKDVVSLLDEQQGALSFLEFDNLATILDEFDVENAFIPNSPHHPSSRAFIDNKSEQDEMVAEGNETTEQPIWAIAKHRGRNEHENILYVSILGSDAIDRFSFQITDDEAGTCVAQTNKVGDFPPYSVIETVREDFEITNIPSFTVDDKPKFSEFLVAIDQLVRRTTSQITPESSPTETMLDKYISSLEVYLAVVAAYEIAPEEYNQGVEEAFSQLGIELTRQTISGLDHSHLDQITTAAFQALEDTEEVDERARELLATTRVQQRRRVDIEEDPDVSLLAQLYDKDHSFRNL